MLFTSFLQRGSSQHILVSLPKENWKPVPAGYKKNLLYFLLVDFLEKQRKKNYRLKKTPALGLCIYRITASLKDVVEHVRVSG